MSSVISSLTVFFSEPFWVGIYERYDGNRYQVSKIVFGAEPKDYEVFEFMLNNWSKLRFTSSVETDFIKERKVNPKRVQREIKRQLKTPYCGTKSQQALQLQHEQNKLERKSRLSSERDAEKERQFAIRQNKKREKHKGH